jgi:hypothetical protein
MRIRHYTDPAPNQTMGDKRYHHKMGIHHKSFKS